MTARRLGWPSRRDFLRVTALGTTGAATSGLWPRGAHASALADGTAERVRVVVVGGGLAGLTTARELVRAGEDSVVVLEARDRVGGRTVNLEIGNGHVVEGGGEWIGPGQDRMAALAAEVGVGTFPSFYSGDTTYDIEGHVSRGLLPDLEAGPTADFLKAAWKLDRECRKLPMGAPWIAEGMEALDSRTLKDWLDERESSSFTHAVFKIITRAIMAGYPERISLLWFLYYMRAAGGLLPLILNDGGAQDLRFEGGSQLVSIRMAEQLGARVRLGSPVQGIVQDDGGVRVHTDKGSLLADRVVVAMMPSDLLRIDFEPALPKQRHELAVGWTRLTRLPLVKLSVLYEKPFWRDHGWNGAMQSDHSPLQLVFDNSPPDASVGVLSCFMSINEAPDFADRAVRERKVCQELARYFGSEALASTGYVEKDWATDPWSTGCITPLTPGVLSRTGPTLREPTGRIHWAGTETAERWCGFMDGAVSSGERAAAEVLAELAPSDDR